MKRLDKNIVKRQLGNKNLSTYEIVSRCSYGYPTVIKNILSKESKNIKTLYWLTCPYLRKKTGVLEQNGFITKISELISENMDKMNSFIKEYREDRKDSICSDVEVHKDILEAGIAGVKEHRYAKCLHAHLAFYLVNKDYFIGKEIAKELNSMECNKKNIICNSYIGREDA